MPPVERRGASEGAAQIFRRRHAALSHDRPADSAAAPREYVLQGMTTQGRPFRPSDWAERLCGVMACYRPGGVATGPDAHLGYSPYVRPTTRGGIKCVVLDERLRDIEPMAFDFVLNFARDNDLVITELCLLPQRGAEGAAGDT